MTTTSHDDQQQGSDGLEPTTKGSAASTDDKRVPVGEHIELRQKLRAAEDAKAALERRLAEVEKSPAGGEPSQEPSTDLAKTVREIQRREQLRDVQAELGLGRQAAEKVLDLMGRMPGLSAEEARTIAANREPKLFETDDNANFDPGVHGVSRPRPGSSPEPEFESDTPKRLDYIRQVGRQNKKEAARMLDNLVGSIAASQVGKKGHKRLPLPRSDQ